jgi:predicted nicotinamide N-methyase
MITTFLHHHTYKWGSYSIDLCIPDPGYVQRLYRGQKDSQPQTPFPYWTQVWPAALAMAEFLSAEPIYVKDKSVVELAGGLGLPSLLAAQWAHSVVCSDYLPEAVAVMKQSVAKNGLPNVSCRILDWNHLPNDLTAEVLLLSDINYDPSQFDMLFKVLTDFINKGTRILLSTPQRLMAKPFLERLLPLVGLKKEMVIDYHQQKVLVTILVLN